MLSGTTLTGTQITFKIGHGFKEILNDHTQYPVLSFRSINANEKKKKPVKITGARGPERGQTVLPLREKAIFLKLRIYFQIATLVKFH